MEVLLGVAAMIVISVLVIAAIRTGGLRRGRRSPGATDEHGAEIQDIFARVDAEASQDLVRLLRVRTQELIGRQVPVRDIRAAPAPRVARIAFSNGTIVLVASITPGDLILMARAMTVTSVTLEQLWVSEEGPMLRFGWNNGHTLQVYAVGLDQAD